MRVLILFIVFITTVISCKSDKKVRYSGSEKLLSNPLAADSAMKSDIIRDTISYPEPEMLDAMPENYDSVVLFQLCARGMECQEFEYANNVKLSYGSCFYKKRILSNGQVKEFLNMINHKYFIDGDGPESTCATKYDFVLYNKGVAFRIAGIDGCNMIYSHLKKSYKRGISQQGMFALRKFCERSGLRFYNYWRDEYDHPEFAELFTKYHVKGSVFIHDKAENAWHYYNRSRFTKEYIPASTFIIFIAMVGLETGVLKDENSVIKWDGIKREVPEWNQDLDLKMAFRTSAEWYFQEVARNVHWDRMKKWVGYVLYGNQNITGGMDHFWLTGDLRISPQKQFEFLRRVYDNPVPFSKRSAEIVKKLMVVEKTPSYSLCAKTGWGYLNHTDYGWYIGWVVKDNKPYYFVTILENKGRKNNDFARARIEITHEALKKLNILN